jgi:hypothetical protein
MLIIFIWRTLINLPDKDQKTSLNGYFVLIFAEGAITNFTTSQSHNTQLYKLLNKTSNKNTFLSKEYLAHLSLDPELIVSNQMSSTKRASKSSHK